MNPKRFYLQLFGLLLFTLLVQYFFYRFQLFVPYLDLGIFSSLFFTGLSVLMYHFGNSSTASTDKNAFTRVAMLSTFGKMLLSVLLIFIYFKIKQPTERSFLFPFFFIYLCFTIFETSFMMKLAKRK